ncbi:MAG TPA: cupredoxin family protein [Burkholderiales bacterium]|nr:cupredoxin family protein [Burkholderiales bacterium]
MIQLAFVAALLFSVPAAAQHSHGAHAHETAFGRPADPAKATRTIRMDMTDNMRFTPAEIRVKRGELVRFVPTNKGLVTHEMVLGTMAGLRRHAEEMRGHSPMSHDDAHSAQVAPGQAGNIGWQFTQPGEFYYACLVPGHFEAGMIGKVIVSP